MILYPVDVFSVSEQVELMLREDPQLAELTTRVSNSEPINEDPNCCPWLGIYRAAIRYPHRAIGTQAGSKYQRIELVIVSQQSHLEDARACGQLLEQLNVHVLRVLFSDQTLRGRVDVLDDIEVLYDRYGLVQNAYMQTSVIHLVGVTTIRGG